MCLGIPGEVVGLVVGTDQLAEVDVLGVRRQVNVGMLDAAPAPGEWVLIHMGFALDRITAQEAADARSGLELMSDGGGGGGLAGGGGGGGLAAGSGSGGLAAGGVSGG